MVDSNNDLSNVIPWQRRLDEYREFIPDPAWRPHAIELFVRSLIDPVPEFVSSFIRQRCSSESDYGSGVKDLYAFLLEKRYEEKLNLLYFAFDIFENATCIPEEIVDQTPFPHESGIPLYRYRLVPGFNLTAE